MAEREELSDPTLVYVIGRLNQGIQREMPGLLAPWELTLPEFTALSVLRRRPGLSNAQLARRALVKPQSMIEILGRLEQRGLAVREADPNHGRILRASLTRKGTQVVTAAERAVDSFQDGLLADVPDRQRRATLRILSRAMTRLSEIH